MGVVRKMWYPISLDASPCYFAFPRHLKHLACFQFKIEFEANESNMPINNKSVS